MRKLVVAGWVLALLAAGLPATSPGAEAASYLSRGPIRIESDANFTAANGVVAGTGSPSDPYVIAGWNIVTAGTAILVRNATSAFVVRDNVIHADVGIAIHESRSASLVANNQLVVRAKGIHVVGADPVVRGNSLMRDTMFPFGASAGIVLEASNATVEANLLDVIHLGIVVERGGGVVRGNNVHNPCVAISARASVGTLVEANTITNAYCYGIVCLEAVVMVVVRNNLTLQVDPPTGMRFAYCKDAEVHNNTVRFARGPGAILDHTSGNFTGNLIVDGYANGIEAVAAPMLIGENRIENNLGVGILLSVGAADVRGNVLERNGVGIRLDNDGAHLTGNVLTNNTIGLDIPYESRQAIPWMSGNLVNGVSVDGAFDANQRVYFYKAANVTLAGGVRDSGFSAGHFGAVSAQGGLVLYEVDTAWVNGTTFAHHDVGVRVVNSWNVNVVGGLVLNARVGILAETAWSPSPVPPCVLSVKGTNVTLDVDPPETVGIETRGCAAFVSRANVSVVDVGIRFQGAVRGAITNVTVHGTRLGLDVEGAPDEIEIVGNTLRNNRIGMRLAGTVGLVAENRILRNRDLGVELFDGSGIRLQRNLVAENGAGLVDREGCFAPLGCSSVAAEDNRFVDNLGVGARVNGPSSWRGDAFERNRGSGLVAGSATLRDVVARANEENGAEVRGLFEVRDSRFLENEGDGLVLVGDGDLWDSDFLDNERAGLRVDATRVAALHLNVSRNFDGIVFRDLAPDTPRAPAPNVPSILLWLDVGPLGPAPFGIHRSTLVGNERDAIRSGGALVDATYNYWGTLTGPPTSVADNVGAYRNGVSPTVRAVPYYMDPEMTQTGPVPIL